MESPRGACLSGGVAVTVAALLLSSCGGGSSPSPAVPSPNPPTVPGATVVNGTERLAWSQAGEVSGLRFVAYVDGSPVSLDTATCSGAPSECTAPLPPLTTGVHTIALAAVSPSGLESVQSESITVQKVSTRSVVGAASFPDARVSPGEARLESTVTASGGLTFAADVVARALKAPLQLASTPDGRLLVADADGRVRVVRPGEPDRLEAALDARAQLDPSPVGPLGLAVHPDFVRNQFVYVSFLAEDGPGRTLLRIVRLREAGDALGEPAAIFEAPIIRATQATRVADDGGNPQAADGLSDDGPRLAFGPDGLLYALLPPGLEFNNEPAASRPRASMLRIADDGRVPEVGPLSGITAHPLGFAWHPSTAVLWLIVPGEDGGAQVRPVTPGSGGDDPGHAVLRMAVGRGSSSGTLALQDVPVSAVGWPGAFATGLDYNAAGVVRLLVPILAEGLLTGISGRIADVVAVGGGTVYLATGSMEASGGGTTDGGDVVMRLRLREP